MFMGSRYWIFKNSNRIVALFQTILSYFDLTYAFIKKLKSYYYTNLLTVLLFLYI